MDLYDFIPKDNIEKIFYLDNIQEKNKKEHDTDFILKCLEKINENCNIIFYFIKDIFFRFNEDEIKRFYEVYKILTTEKFGYVYFLKNVNTNLFKVGSTTNLNQRIKTIKSNFKNNMGIDDALDLFAVIATPFSTGLKLEKKIHSHFKSKKKFGEWFEISENDIFTYDDIINSGIIEEFTDYLMGVDYETTDDVFLGNYDNLFDEQIIYKTIILSMVDFYKDDKAINSVIHTIYEYLYKGYPIPLLGYILDKKSILCNMFNWMIKNRDSSIDFLVDLKKIDGQYYEIYESVGLGVEKRYNITNLIDNKIKKDILNIDK